MGRYFIEVAYRGTDFSGFQVQDNARTIQSEVERALQVLFKDAFSLTGSSRTDAGVHARQNFFHVDTLLPVDAPGKIYNLNAILDNDIVIKSIKRVGDFAHCRFDARHREYKYYIYFKKDPFLQDRAYYFPYNSDFNLLNEAAALLLQVTDFTSFAKRNTQVNNFNCSVQKSKWIREEGLLIYNVAANRFLRGMVKGLTGTMLLVGTGKMTLNQFREVIVAKNCARANFAVPSHGLFLERVVYE